MHANIGLIGTVFRWLLGIGLGVLSVAAQRTLSVSLLLGALAILSLMTALTEYCPLCQMLAAKRPGAKPGPEPPGDEGRLRHRAGPAS